MYKDKKILAIIPARGGSKRLPKKNILPFLGDPLIARSIKTAKKSRYIDEVVVSSDSDEILNIAAKYKAMILKRPENLSSDTAGSYEVCEHVLNSLDEKYDEFILLQPTSPLRRRKDIDKAIEYFHDKNASCVVSVCECEHSPLWSNTLPKNKSMKKFLKTKGKRSQDLPTFYRLNGAIYLLESKKALKQKSLFLDKKIYAFVMKTKHSVDIDTLLDFKMAEFLAKENKKIS